MPDAPYIIRRCEALTCGGEPNGVRVEMTLGELRQLLQLARHAALAWALGEALTAAWGENDRLRAIIGLAAKRLARARRHRGALQALEQEQERRRVAEKRLRRARSALGRIADIAAHG